MAVKSQAAASKVRHEESGRETILNAAERLFAERGIDAVSLRTINAEPGWWLESARRLDAAGYAGLWA